MASLGHVAVGLAAGRAFRGRRRRPMLAFALLALAPDADVIGFRLGIPYASPFGHRGSAHSLLFAGLLALTLATLGGRSSSPGEQSSPPRTGRLWWAGVTFAVVASHGLLDTLTDGGLGVALLWPFSHARFFAPWRPIPVAPIGLALLSRRGLYVMLTELFLFAPCLMFAFWPAGRTGRNAATDRPASG